MEQFFFLFDIFLAAGDQQIVGVLAQFHFNVGPRNDDLFFQLARAQQRRDDGVGIVGRPRQ
ncbi:hypothetical protein [Mesorhizobium sp. M1396]|uniref:hypothetical protein n=1 Tax=Mesorhizobium sp. M1396 TaxID=2957095 RepID=UPI003334FF2E